MKKIISVVLLVSILLINLTGCQPTQERDLLEVIKEKGVITVAMEGTWAPFTYHDENDILVGFDVDIAKAVADKLGVKAEFVEVEWNGLLAGVQTGRYDIAANGVEYTDERAKAYNMSEPYAYSYVALIVRSDEDRIKSFEDLKGMTTANTLQSTYATIAESYGATVKSVDDFIQTIELLLDGRIDATLNADTSIYDYLKTIDNPQVKIAAMSEEPNHVCIITKKDESTNNLIDVISQAISELREEGKLAEISMKYFGADITKK